FLNNCMKSIINTIEKLQSFYVGDTKTHNQLLKIQNEIILLMDENQNMKRSIQNQLNRIDLRGQLIIKALTRSELIAEKYKRKLKQLENKQENSSKENITQQYKAKYSYVIDILKKLINQIEQYCKNIGSEEKIMNNYLNFLQQV